MKILCTKDEFAQMLLDCSFNRTGEGNCENCLFRRADWNREQCVRKLVNNCEIVEEDGE